MFKFYHYKILTSTNDKAKEFSKKGLSNIVIAAEIQTKGKGSFNRNWISDIGGLYMTIVSKEKNLEKSRYLTLISSIAVAKTIIKLSNLKAQVKWPNDVLVNDKKICGILTEIISGKENYALVGIGLNVNQIKFGKNIIATSLKIETNKNYNIKKITNEIIRQFYILYQYYKNKKYEKIINVWKKYSHTLGKRVKAKTLSGTYTGKAVNIDKGCNLVLELGNGSIKKIIEGDIFVV